MPETLAVGDHFEAFIQAQVENGHYRDASEVIRGALQLMESREDRLAALDLALARGCDDLDGGRAENAEDVFDALATRYRQA